MTIDVGRVGVADRAALEPSQSALSRPYGEHPSRVLLGKVLDYYEGRAPYDFYRLHDDEQRRYAAHDAWQEIAGEIASELGRVRKTKRQRRRERDALAGATGTAKTPKAAECEASQSGTAQRGNAQ